MIRYQTEKFTLNMLEVYTSNYAGCGINVDDGYIYVEWKDKFNPYSEPKRKYFVQYYNTILCVPQDEFEAHYRNIQYFVDDLGRALEPVVTGDRPTESERNIMIENIKKRVL